MKRLQKDTADKALYRILRKFDQAYEYDFTDVAEDVFVMDSEYPLPDTNFLQAIKSSLLELGRPADVYISLLEGTEEMLKEGVEWEASLDELLTLDQWEMLETAIYCPQGTWAVILSHEGVAGVGGEKRFMTLLKKYYPRWRKQQDAIEDWQWPSAPKRFWQNDIKRSSS